MRFCLVGYGKEHGFYFKINEELVKGCQQEGGMI